VKEQSVRPPYFEEYVIDNWWPPNDLESENLQWGYACSPRDLPNLPGVYVIKLGSRVLYVGSAVSLRKRFYLHQIDCGRINGNPFNGDRNLVHIEFSLMDKSFIRDVEKRLIGELSPEMNYMFNRGHGVKN
jgi:hypothetical protein